MTRTVQEILADAGAYAHGAALNLQRNRQIGTGLPGWVSSKAAQFRPGRPGPGARNERGIPRSFGQSNHTEDRPAPMRLLDEWTFQSDETSAQDDRPEQRARASA